MITVLVTGAGGGVGQGIIKSLKMIDDLEIKIISADMSAVATGLYSGDVAYLVSACTDAGYMDSLEMIFRTEKVDYYFPGTDVELQFCASNKQYIEEKNSVRIVVSPLEAINLSDDKYKTYQFLKENSFSHPWTCLAKDADVEKLDFPVIVKPAVGCRSIGVYVVESKAELQRHVSTSNNLVIQELLGDETTEYTCTIVKVGEVVSPVLALRRTLRSGDTFRAEPIKNEMIEEYVRDVALALNIYGSCNFQLRLDGDDIPKIFEINCRFSGTTPFCAQLGFNPVEFFLKNSIGLDYQYDIDFESVVLRYWSEVLIEKKALKDIESTGSISPSVMIKSGLFY